MDRPRLRLDYYGKHAEDLEEKTMTDTVFERLSDTDLRRVFVPVREESSWQAVREYNIETAAVKIRIQIEFIGQEPNWMRPLVAKFGEILSLPPNWDSYGASPIDPECAILALRLVLSIMKVGIPVPAIVPTNRGRIQIEWHTRGIDLEIEIASPGRLKLYYENHRTGEEWEKELTSDLTVLAESLTTLTQQT